MKPDNKLKKTLTGIKSIAEQRDTIKRILVLIGKYRILVFVSLILAALTTALTLYIPILTGNAVDCVIGEGNVDFNGLMSVLIKIVKD